jgi:hypothetical protein
MEATTNADSSGLAWKVDNLQMCQVAHPSISLLSMTMIDSGQLLTGCCATKQLVHSKLLATFVVTSHRSAVAAEFLTVELLTC